jgi:diguanylate cyclase
MASQETNPKPPELSGHFKVAYDAAALASQIAYAARHDQLTGMLTKDAWKHEIKERLQIDQPFGVIFMDMDAFKKVNDTFGHERGDSILEQFGTHMRKNFQRSSDVLAHEQLFKGEEATPTMGRYGGDEFGLIVDLTGNNNRSSDPLESMDKTIEHLQLVLDDFVKGQPADIQALGFDVSIGSAIRSSGEEATAGELVERADKAMYEAKRIRAAAR